VVKSATNGDSTFFRYLCVSLDINVSLVSLLDSLLGSLKDWPLPIRWKEDFLSGLFLNGDRNCLSILLASFISNLKELTVFRCFLYSSISFSETYLARLAGFGSPFFYNFRPKANACSFNLRCRF